MHKGGIKIFFMFLIMIIVIVVSASIFTMDYHGDDITGQAHDFAGRVIEENSEKVTEKIAETGKEKIGEALKDVGEKILYEEYDDSGYFGVYDQDLFDQYEKNVLFFTAEWCPSCTALESVIEEKKNYIPPYTSIMLVDFDNQSMREEYEVVKQHTFILLDEENNEIKRWTNSDTLEDVIYNTK